jgi:hypothetical protein
MSDRIRDAILALGQREKVLRAQCNRGEISDADSRWVTEPRS